MIPEDLVPADCPWPIVLGIDPGTRVLGYGALVVAPEGPRLVACGVLRADARDTIAARLSRFAAELELLMARLRPAVVVIEGVFAAQNVRSALRIGEARGAVLAVAGRSAAQVIEIAPAAAKKALLGHGAASKPQVAAMVARLLGLATIDAPADATDALSLALAHVARMRVLDAVARARGSLARRALP